MAKKTYTKPRVHKLGTVAELTLTGRTRPGRDMKHGSKLSQGR